MKIWCEDFRDKVYTDAGMRDVTRFRGISLKLGRKVRERFPADATIEIRSKRPPTDFFMAGSFPAVSLKLKAILDDFAVQAEYLPVRLVRKSGALIPGEWSCFNVTKVVDCFDRERSQFSLDEGDEGEIERLVIKEAACGNASLVLTEKIFPSLWVVQEDLAKAIEEAGCSGVLFKNPEDWRNPRNPVD